MYVKLDINNNQQIDFLKKELRPFYSKDILKWQYYRFENNNACLYLTQHNSEYIASQGMIPIHLTYLNKIWLTAKSETSFLLPKYRGKGLFEELYFYTIDKAEEDNTQLIWGFTALSNVWKKKLKFETFDGLISETELQLSFKLAMHSVFTSKKSIKNILKSTVRNVFAKFKRKRIPNTYFDLTTKEMDWNNKQYINSVLDVFLNWKDKYSTLISIDLTYDYLNWRIQKNPKLNYKLIGLYNKNKLYGFAIINVTKNYTYLVEFIVPDKTLIDKGLFSLLKHCISTKKISHINYWSSNQNEYSKLICKTLIELGGRELNNNNMNFVYKKTLCNSLPEIDAESFYINGLWTEGFSI